MLSEEQLLRADDVIAELRRGDRISPTDIWMAYYLEELTLRSQRAKTLADRRNAADRCAEIIGQFWARRVSEAAARMEAALPRSFGPMALASKWTDELRAVLSAGEERAVSEEWDSRVRLLTELGELEERVLRTIAAEERATNDADPDAAAEALALFPDRLGVAVRSLADLADTLPELSPLGDSGGRVGLEPARRVLAVIHAVRERLI